jgi:hypothetical protein
MGKLRRKVTEVTGAYFSEQKSRAFRPGKNLDETIL